MSTLFGCQKILLPPRLLADVLPGFFLATQRYPGRPLRLVDIGACAGLQLVPECFEIRYPRVNWCPVTAKASLVSDLDVPPALMAVAFWSSVRNRIESRPWLLKWALWSIPLPWLACEVGWFVAEYGRQPWTVQGMLPTHLSTSESGRQKDFLTTE